MSGNGNGAALTKFNPNGFAEYVKANRGALQAVAASHVDLKRLYRLVTTCVVQTPALRNCTMPTIFRALQQSAELGLEPGGALGECYLVPFANECQLIIGYRGLIAMARRSGTIQSIEAFCVFEEDEFEVELGLNRVLRHKPSFCEPNPNKIRFAYAIARLKDGGVQFDVMTRQEVEAIRGRSKAGRSGPWVTDWAEMAKKTVVRRLSKLLPMSIEMAKALDVDAQSEIPDVDFGEGVSLDVPTHPALTTSEDSPLDADITEVAAEPQATTDAPPLEMAGVKR